MMVLKTIVNSWTSSYRYHESVLLECVFGCHLLHPLPPGAAYHDSLEHYLVCKKLWRIIEDIFPGVSVPRSVPA